MSLLHSDFLCPQLGSAALNITGTAEPLPLPGDKLQEWLSHSSLIQVLQEDGVTRASAGGTGVREGEGDTKAHFRELVTHAN